METYFLAGLFSYYHTKNYQDALERFKLAKATGIDNLDINSKIGGCLIRLNNLDGGIDYLENFTKNNDEFPPLLFLSASNPSFDLYFIAS